MTKLNRLAVFSITAALASGCATAKFQYTAEEAGLFEGVEGTELVNRAPAGVEAPLVEAVLARAGATAATGAAATSVFATISSQIGVQVTAATWATMSAAQKKQINDKLQAYLSKEANAKTFAAKLKEAKIIVKAADLVADATGAQGASTTAQVAPNKEINEVATSIEQSVGTLSNGKSLGVRSAVVRTCSDPKVSSCKVLFKDTLTAINNVKGLLKNKATADNVKITIGGAVHAMSKTDNHFNILGTIDCANRAKAEERDLQGSQEWGTAANFSQKAAVFAKPTSTVDGFKIVIADSIAQSTKSTRDAVLTTNIPTLAGEHCNLLNQAFLNGGSATAATN